MSFFTDFTVDAWLRDVVTDCWLSLHFDDPDQAGAYASEVYGGSYKRAKVPFTDPDSRATFSASDATWKGLPTVVVTHLGGWDASLNGNLWWSMPLPTPIKIIAGKSLTIPAFDIALSID